MMINLKILFVLFFERFSFYKTYFSNDNDNKDAIINRHFHNMAKAIFQNDFQNEIIFKELFSSDNFGSQNINNPLIGLLIHPETRNIICQYKYDNISHIQAIFNIINSPINRFSEIPINLQTDYNQNINVIAKQLFFNNFDLIKNLKNNSETPLIKSILNHPCFNSLNEKEQILYTDFVKHINGSPNINKKKTLNKRI